MATNEKVLANGPRNHVIRLTQNGVANATATEVVDRSVVYDIDKLKPDTVAIEKIKYHVWGYDEVSLLWDFSTDENIAVIGPGDGEHDWTDVGGLHPKTRNTASGTGDVLLQTATQSAAGTLSSGYDITLYCKRG